MTFDYHTLVSLCGFALIGIFCLIILWAESIKEDGEDDTARKQLCDRQDKDIDLDGEPHAKYTIYENGKIAFSTHNFKLAKDAFEAMCMYQDTDIEWYADGHLIGSRAIRKDINNKTQQQ